MVATFCQVAFSKNALILTKKIQFLTVTFTFLHHFSILLLILLLFGQFWRFSEVLENIEKS